MQSTAVVQVSKQEEEAIDMCVQAKPAYDADQAASLCNLIARALFMAALLRSTPRIDFSMFHTPTQQSRLAAATNQLMAHNWN
jgi:hypothetical protein